MSRGRPKGSKNKSKELKETSSEIKQLKKQIRDLRAEKLRLPAGDKKRIELHRQIKELKILLLDKKEIKIQKEVAYNNPEKEKLIAEILKLEPELERIKDIFDLNKFSEQELKNHIDYVKRKRNKSVII